MVHQASTLPDPKAARRRRQERAPAPERLRQRRPVPDRRWSRIAGLAPQRLLVVFLIALVLPFSFEVAGLQLNAYNSVLIVCIIPALLYFIHLPDARIVGLDVFMALHVLWLGVAIYHAYGSDRIVFIINQSLVLFGAYFMGRVLVRSAEDHARLFRIMLRILLALCPLAFIEFAGHVSLIDMAMGRGGGGGAGGFRLGFRRVESVFPHPILFGCFVDLHRELLLRLLPEPLGPALEDGARHVHDLHGALLRAAPGDAGAIAADRLGAAAAALPA